MVSRKWTCQLSSGHRFPSAAAAPPSAITVCALPSSDLQTTATLAPASCAAIAARSPEPPAPITITSYRWVSTSAPTGVVVSGTESVISARLSGSPRRCSRGEAKRRGRGTWWGSKEPRVGEGAGRDQHDVQVGEGDGEQRQPGVAGVARVELRD